MGGKEQILSRHHRSLLGKVLEFKVQLSLWMHNATHAVWHGNCTSMRIAISSRVDNKALEKTKGPKTLGIRFAKFLAQPHV